MPFETKPTEKQIEANCLNALKSTGPKTEEGKNRSRLNAHRHGLTSMVTIMTDPDREAHNKFMAAYIADLNPEGARETHLAQSIAYDAWRMNRIRAIEENAFALGMNRPFADVECGHPEIHSASVQAMTFWQDPGKFALLSLYEQRILRGFHKNSALYREIRRERNNTAAKQPSAVSEKPLTMAAGAAAGTPSAAAGTHSAAAGTHSAAAGTPESTEAPPKTIANSNTSGENGFVRVNPEPAAPAIPHAAFPLEKTALHHPNDGPALRTAA